MFEDIKHIDEQGQEYWKARELQIVLEYAQWRRFYDVINKAIIACINSNNNVNEHFAKVGKTINMPEQLPTPNKSLKQLEKEQHKLSSQK
jgi:DNA-damage-inducible protein D